MSLRKSPTRTPALLEANRRNARKSTGPRTAQGKAQTRMNAWRNGDRSRLRRDLWVRLLSAPLGRVEEWAKALMTPEMNLSPHLREVAEIIIEADRPTGRHVREPVSGQKRK
jgi:hypothetical protein